MTISSCQRATDAFVLKDFECFSCIVGYSDFSLLYIDFDECHGYLSLRKMLERLVLLFGIQMLVYAYRESYTNMGASRIL